MKNLIIGDIRRILCKKSMWLAFVIAIAAIVGIVMYALSFMKDSSFVFATSVISGIVDLGAIIIGVAVFLAVYGDDFKSMSIISIIGRGNSRRKLIISKFINSVILSALLYLVLSAVVFAFSIFMEMELLPDEALAMYLGVFKGFYLTVYVTMAAIAIYATGNIPFSVFIVVLFYMILPTVLSLTSLLPVVKNWHLDRYDYNGLASTGLSSIVLGMTGKGIFLLILDFAVYVGGAIAIIYLVFNKKELDF